MTDVHTGETGRHVEWRRRPIILFDRTSFTRRLTADLLRHAGASLVRPCRNPGDALRALASAHRPIFIADWRAEALIPDMPAAEAEPGEDALSLARRLRRSSSTARRAPLLILSARRRESDVVAARDAGADGFLARPLSPRDLVMRLEAINAPRPFVETRTYAGPDRRKPRPETGLLAYKRGEDVELGRISPLEAAYNQADQIAEDLMRAGDPLGERVARSLRRALDRDAGVGFSLEPRTRAVIQLHREAAAELRALRGQRSAARIAVVDGLERLTETRLAA